MRILINLVEVMTDSVTMTDPQLLEVDFTIRD